jgi:ribonuclease-3
MKKFKDFEKIIGVSFNDINLLKKAFTHRSYINEHAGLGLEHNERLEFLGDAVLELAITHDLFEMFPEKPEGELTALRAALVNTNSLGESAEKLGMNDFLLLSKGESKDAGKARLYILADTFEALIGSIYLDQDYAAAFKFIKETIFIKIDEIIKNKLWQDAKSLVQEKVQENLGVTPFYKTISESGPDHDKTFTMGIFFGEELVAEAKGKSKQEAEQEAAQKALEVKGWLE